MADYYTIAQVEAILPKGIKIDDSTSDPPTRANVTATIPDITKQIDDAATEGGETVPLTGSKAGTASLRGRREHAWQIIAQRGLVYDKDRIPYWDKWHTEFEAYLVLLSGVEAAAAGVLTDSSTPWGYTMDANTEDPSDSKNPSFTKDYVP
jgi:hypothetical protein